MNQIHPSSSNLKDLFFSTELELENQHQRFNKPSSRRAWMKSMLLGQLQSIEGGEITLHQPQLDSVSLGEIRTRDDLDANIVIGNDDFYSRIMFGGTIGAAQSYMAGDWVTDSLTDVIRIMIRNLRKMTLLEKSCAWFKNRIYWLQHVLRRNSVEGSRKNIHAHYDLGNDFYKLFLDPTMNYSCGVFDDGSKMDREAMHAASRRKMRLICEKLALSKEDHVVEIGTGWGGLAIFMVENYGCRVTTTTISKEQYKYAIAAIEKAGLSDQIEVLLKDYRHLEGKYDKLVSIEMIEAVGHQYYDEYFNKCASLLKDHGAMLLQAITISEQNYNYHVRHVDFIRRYVFPGGCLPSIGALNQAAISQSDMRMLHLEDLTPHYVKTLQCWRFEFMSQLDRVREMGYSDEFVRLWHFYLCYCEAAFAERRVHLAHLVYCKPGCSIDPAEHYRDLHADASNTAPRLNNSVRFHRRHSSLFGHVNAIPDQLLAQKNAC